jgi:hypothetical protein
MKTLNKLFLAITLSVSLISSAFAGEVSVTGAAKASYRINSSDSSSGAVSQGKGLGISNELSFSASGELDNGWTWAWGVDFDQADRTIAGGGIDDSKLVLGTPFGAIGLFNSEGSLRAAAYGWDVSAFGAGTDNGAGGTFQAGYEISSLNNIQYHTPADLLPFGISAKVAYAMNGDAGPIDFKGAGTQATSAAGSAWSATTAAGLGTRTTGTVFDNVTQYTVSAAPIDGLTIVADYTDFSHVDSAQEAEEGHIAAKYAIGSVTLGAGRGYISPENSAGDDNVEFFKNTSYGIGFKVNDALSLSYTKEKSEMNLMTRSAKEVDLEVTSIQAAYNIGGATIAISQDGIDNSNYTLNKDEKETLVTLVMAF